MQMPLTSLSHVQHCRSASASDIQLCSRRHLRNCCHERVSVNSCSENAPCEWPLKAAIRLFSVNDADEMVCRCWKRNTEAVTGHLPSRPMSSHVIVSPFHSECHCVACCSCSPCDRRSGNCPTFTFPIGTLSAQRALSLDSGLTLCRSCSRRLSAAKDSSFSSLVRSSVQECDAVIHKSSSVPACCSSQMRYYTAGISFDSLNDDTCQTYNNGVFSTSSSESSPPGDDAKSTGSVNLSAMSPDDDSVPLLGTLSTPFNTEVSPVEYHKRFMVCLFLCLFV